MLNRATLNRRSISFLSTWNAYFRSVSNPIAIFLHRSFRDALLSGSCSSARSFAPRFLPTLGRPHAVALRFARCDQLTMGFAPIRVRPCWAHHEKGPRLGAFVFCAAWFLFRRFAANPFAPRPGLVGATSIHPWTRWTTRVHASRHSMHFLMMMAVFSERHRSARERDNGRERNCTHLHVFSFSADLNVCATPERSASSLRLVWLLESCQGGLTRGSVSVSSQGKLSALGHRSVAAVVGHDAGSRGGLLRSRRTLVFSHPGTRFSGLVQPLYTRSSTDERRGVVRKAKRLVNAWFFRSKLVYEAAKPLRRGIIILGSGVRVPLPLPKIAIVSIYYYSVLIAGTSPKAAVANP